ncbi:hypothetical protein B2G88_13875 [Natronolimnobius baerhuensis]|uniref:Uncharacterized protein n=1 Tax=Natronolimnobius baerhuensis TaxID=253108 RepID=A0A202E5F2_9EURY|nr:hypothetical protein B2G88_13875 [Natronolimnobius baerhuensis]
MKIGRSTAAVSEGDGREFATGFSLTSVRQYHPRRSRGVASVSRCRETRKALRQRREWHTTPSRGGLPKAQPIPVPRW